MKKYLLIALLPLLNLAHATGDFSISDDFINTLFVVFIILPIGFILFMIFISSSINKYEKEDKNNKENNDQ